jgi:tyrosyl-tRNA synthetase
MSIVRSDLRSAHWLAPSARSCTAPVTAAVEHATSILFPSESSADGGGRRSDAAALGDVLGALPHAVVTRAELFAKPIVTLLVDTEACASKTAARKLVLGGGCYVGGRRIDDVNYVVRESDMSSDQFLVLRTGKKTYRIVRVTPTARDE